MFLPFSSEMTCTSSNPSSGSTSRLCFAMALAITAGVLSWLVSYLTTTNISGYACFIADCLKMPSCFLLKTQTLCFLLTRMLLYRLPLPCSRLTLMMHASWAWVLYAGLWLREQGDMGVREMHRLWVPGHPGSEGEAGVMEQLAVDELVSMECSEVQDDDSESWGETDMVMYECYLRQQLKREQLKQSDTFASFKK